MKVGYQDIETAQLQAFVIVAQEYSFTRAAERLNLSQPSLSARIRQLEHLLDCTLFHRHKRPVELTPIGTIFLEYAKRSLGILEAGVDAVHLAQTGVTGRVLVGCPSSVATYLMPAVVNKFHQQYPLVDLHIDVGNSDTVVSQLLDGVHNLVFAAAFPRFSKLGAPLLQLPDEMVVAVSPQHPLTQKQNVLMEDLWQYRTLLIHWGDTFNAYINSLRQISQIAGTILSVPLAAALPMTHQINTITFMPRRLAIASGLVEVPIADFQFSWTVILLTRAGRKLFPAEQAFVDVVNDIWQSNNPN